MGTIVSIGFKGVKSLQCLQRGSLRLKGVQRGSKASRGSKRFKGPEKLKRLTVRGSPWRRPRPVLLIYNR